MEFPDTQATHSTENIMRTIKPELKEGTSHYNRVFSAIHKELTEVLPYEKPPENVFGKPVIPVDVGSMSPKDAETVVKEMMKSDKTPEYVLLKHINRFFNKGDRVSILDDWGETVCVKRKGGIHTTMVYKRELRLV